MNAEMLLRTKISIPITRLGAVCRPREISDILLAAFFASRVPEMVIPYADAAAFMLNNLQPTNAISRHRIGLALPIGMKSKKAR